MSNKTLDIEIKALAKELAMNILKEKLVGFGLIETEEKAYTTGVHIANKSYAIAAGFIGRLNDKGIETTEGGD